MAVHPDVTRQHIRDEMSRVEDLAGSCGWEVDLDYGGLIVVVRMQAHTGDRFIVEARCDNYKEMPPFIEFTDPVSGEKGTARRLSQGEGRQLLSHIGSLHLRTVQPQGI